ncbi:MAG: hypothetical protein IH807_00795 [Proteobacteria bacterium]|nr:hypothetical protein [Pseudomonadota bacterium]
MFLFLNPDYRVGVFGGAIWYLAASIYFAIHGRKTLVYSPEEEFCGQGPRRRRSRVPEPAAGEG